MSSFLNKFEQAYNSEQGGTVMMALGPLRFGVLSQEYESLKTSMSWRWAEKARYLREPALQYHGPGTITKTIDVVVVAEYGSDLDFIPLIQTLADTGQPQRMVAGSSRSVGGVKTLAGGAAMGLWCLTDLSVDESEFLRDGTSILQKATLTVKSYGEDVA